MKYQGILFLSELNDNFLNGFSKNTYISNFIKIRPVGSEFHTDRHDEAFSNFANASKIYQLLPWNRVALQNPRVSLLFKNSAMAHYGVHKRPLMLPKRNQTNSFHILATYFHTHVSIILSFLQMAEQKFQ
jgi:hypothetical protein